MPDIAETTPATALAFDLATGSRDMDAKQLGEYAIIHSTLWLMYDLAARRPLLLTIDDLQWADIPSLRCLAYASSRLANVDLAIACATGPGVERVQDNVAITYSDDWLIKDLEPLSTDAANALLARVIHETPSDHLVRRCHELTRGNPLLLHEVGQRLRVTPATQRSLERLGP